MRFLTQRGHFPSGNPRQYFRRKGQGLIPMPDAPMDAPEFLKVYASALDGSGPASPRVSHPTGTIGAGVRAYLASDLFLRLAPSTRDLWRRGCESIEDEYGTGRLKDLRAVHIRRDMAKFKPNPANMRRKIWRSLGKFWLQAGLVEDDPSAQVASIRIEDTGGHVAWTADDAAAFRSTWPTSTQQRLAFELMYRTCAAIGDACRLGPQNVKDGWLTHARTKTATPFAAPMTTEVAPGWFAFNPEFDECVSQHPRHLTYIVTSKGAPKSAKSAAAWFSSACRKAGISVTAHGIRKYRAAQFKENGATPEQRMAVLGHASLAMATKYSKSADLTKIITGTKSVNSLNQSVNNVAKAL